MTVRDLIRELLEHPLDCQVYVGKGMGPLAKVEPVVSDIAVACVVVSP